MLEQQALGTTLDASAEAGNWAILATAGLAACALLTVASHTSSSLLFLTAAILFAFVNNCLFSLLHEAVHGKFAQDSERNAVAGTIAAAFFPTSFTLQRSAHLTHHRNNRSDLERFDYIGPDENIPLKTGQWFSILTGFYWLGIPFALTVYVLFAELIPWKRLVRPGSRFATQTSAGEFLESLMRLPLWRVRAEFLFSVAVQAGLVWALDLTLLGWAACYGAFALAWSSLQYADHAFTRLDRDEGAWNLRVGSFTRRMFLNYHDHLEHHREPSRPWRILPSRVDTAQHRPRFVEILYLMWQGPRLLPGSHQSIARHKLLQWSIIICHAIIFGLAFALLYGLSSMRFPMHDSLYSVDIPLDRLVPFVPSAGWMYITIVPLMLVTAFILGTAERTLPFLAALMLQLVVAVLLFEFVPVPGPIPPTMRLEEPGRIGFMIADTVNLNGNYFPSLHVALAVSCTWAAWPRVAWAGRLALSIWAAAICVSTLLTWQHWVLDVVAGAGMAALVMGAIYPRLIAARDRIEAMLIAHPASSVGKS